LNTKLNPHKILLLESNPETANQIASMLSANNYKVQTALNSSEFENYLVSFNPEVIVIDLNIQNSLTSGVEVLRSVTDNNNQYAKIIVFSNDNRLSWINEIHKIGSYKVYDDSKPYSLNNLLSHVESTSKPDLVNDDIFRTRVENIFLKKNIIQTHPFFGESVCLTQAKEKIVKLAKADEDMFVVGETGTGKEVAVFYYYLNSNRFGKPFQTVNCSALTETLIESELFGHKKGAFTSADKTKVGHFELSNKGVLFLDEITNLSLGAQSKLLRAVENQEIQIVGGEAKKIDVKILFASNASLDMLTDPNVLRKDLFYRIESNLVELPPLREREDDILVLINYFLTKYSLVHHVVDFDSITYIKDQLLSYPWPGNVRELKNFCKFVLLNEREVTAGIIQNYLDKKVSKVPKTNTIIIDKFFDMSKMKDSVSAFEKEYLLHHLTKNKWRINHTAKQIGIERTTLYKKLKLYGLNKEENS